MIHPGHQIPLTLIALCYAGLAFATPPQVVITAPIVLDAPLHADPPAGSVSWVQPVPPSESYLPINDLLKSPILPDKTTVTIDGTTVEIEKLQDQSHSALAFDVIGGWPDGNGRTQPAVAKTDYKFKFAYKNEQTFLDRMDRLIHSGSSNNGEHRWLVTKKLPGMSIIFTEPFKKAKNPMECNAIVEARLPIIVKKARAYIEAFGVWHQDLRVENVIWNSQATEADFINWGQAAEVPDNVFKPEIEEYVRYQVSMMPEKTWGDICGAIDWS
ncbi:hypothetical protein PLICRDRAFT_86920 [Plicaturopsis crispa FD-325 SS-3]|nr:hypothetical protein PLICRDRAFT_86920 [Plicaturopsis crispa FD-325 SS-3]